VPIINNLEDNQKFCEVIKHLLNSHQVAIPELARGIATSSAYISLDETDKFMNETLRSRIG
jgi:hypothetical protein